MKDVRDAIERAAKAIGWSGRIIAQTARPGDDGLILVNGIWLVEGRPEGGDYRYRVSYDGTTVGRADTPDGAARVVVLAVVMQRVDESLGFRVPALAPAAAAKGGET